MHRRRRSAVFLSAALAVALAAGGACPAQIIVDREGWGDFESIQPALDGAPDGAEILVQAGEYLIPEPLDFNRLHDPGDPGSPSPRNLVLRSSEGAGATTIRIIPGGGSAVVFRSGEDRRSVLEGFTITGGSGTTIVVGDRPYVEGGGIRLSRSSPTIRGCRIEGNRIEGDGEIRDFGGASGGGIACSEGSSPAIERCAITGNSARGDGAWGGGISIGSGCAPLLRDCTISGNLARGDDGIEGGGPALGGGVYVDGTSFEIAASAPVFRGCRIAGNTARSGDATGVGLHSSLPSTLGGGIFGAPLSRISLTNCLIEGNRVVPGAGDLRPSLDDMGGGLFLDDMVSAPMGARGGGRSAWASSASLANCLVAGNIASEGGGAYCLGDASIDLRNCIVWGHAGGSIELEEPVFSSVTASCLDGDELPPGEGNTSADPLLASIGRWDGGGTEDPGDDVYLPGDGHPLPGSPAIDAGVLEGAPAVDLDGSGRPCGGGVDLGPHEAGGCPPPAPFRRGDANADGTLDLADPIAVLERLFLGGAVPPCLAAADADGNGRVDITDPIAVLGHLFLGGSPPPEPFDACGIDGPATPGCASFPPCG